VGRFEIYIIPDMIKQGGILVVSVLGRQGSSELDVGPGTWWGLHTSMLEPW
jgi:hypothetical protein